MTTARQILASFNDNISHAAAATGISRQSWHNWKRRGWPRTLHPKLELWLLRRGNEGKAGR